MDGSLVVDGATGILPRQNWRQILLHAERYRLAAEAQRPWAEKAKVCTDFLENKQWTDTDLAKLFAEGRPALVINKIRPLFDLVMGYHLNNQFDISYGPGNDGTGSADLARVHTMIAAQIKQQNQLQFIDAEVFRDGLTTGRGYFDCRMDFEKNMYGEVRHRAADPFSVFPDPDADDYDLNTGSHITTSRWASLDEIGFFYGDQASQHIRPIMSGGAFSPLPTGYYEGEEISPWRTFGGDDENGRSYGAQGMQFYDWIDTYRKTVRMLDIQHYVRVWQWFFVDAETGEQTAVPDFWGEAKVQRVLMTANARGEHVVLQRKQVRRLRWTHMVADLVVYDQWADYESFSLVGYFPYFRRGQTQGMVEFLLDSQREVNVRRSARQNIIGRSSNGGWDFAKGSLNAQERANLERNGGRPGFTLEYDTKGGTLPKPAQIQPAQSPVSVAELEKEAGVDMKEIAGINEAALGQVDQANASGRAILARQQQTVIGLEQFNSSFHRSKLLLGKKQIQLVRTFYTQQRIIRITGKGSGPLSATINERTAERVVNDVTNGNFDTVVEETSLTESFLAGQFNELMQMKEMGMPIPDEFLVDASSIGRKDELTARLAAAREAEAAAAAAGAAQGGPAGGPAPGGGGTKAGGPPPAGRGPGGSRTGADGGSMPAGPEPGSPQPSATA